MAYVEVKIPDVVRIEYRAGADDPDRYRCRWANFEFDQENYSLQIMSDQGNFAYGWHPTQTETFIDLCKRFDSNYLLSKISEATVVNPQVTYDNLLDLIADNCLETPNSILPEGWKTNIKDIVDENVSSSDSLFFEISNLLHQWYFDEIENFEIWECIETRYPFSARVVVEVYMKYIKPELYKLEG